jgi:EmrB/QacA subfamily drug resistance transporter
MPLSTRIRALVLRGRRRVRRPARSAKASFRVTALIVASALFMQQLDSTVLATALPSMARDFTVSPLHMSLALTAYLLGLSVFIPASGTVADRFGALKVFRIAIAVFVLGSILCGQAPNLPFLVAARFFQGMGGAMMIPVGRLLLLKSVSRKDMVLAMSWFTVPALVGPIIGPPLGGLIVTALSWRWIFYLNLPFGILGIFLAGRYLRDVREERPDRFDRLGFVLSALALSGFMAGLELASRGGVPRWAALSVLGVGILFAFAYLRHARRTVAPILDLSLLRIPTFGLSVIGGSLTRISGGALPFLLPMMMQLGFGFSPVKSGLVTFSAAAGSLLMKVASAPMLRLLGLRAALVWNGVLASLLLAACALFRPAWPIVAIYAVLFLGGFFQSIQFTAYNTIAYADVPQARMSAATSLYTTIQQTMLSTGICVSSGALAVSTALAGHLSPRLSDFSVAFLAVTAISLIAAPVCARLPRGTGDDMSGHHTRRKIHPGHLEAT